MIFFTSESSHFSDKAFSNIKKALKVPILIFAIFVTYYQKWDQSINLSSIESTIKINLGKDLELNSLATVFFEKMVLHGFKNCMGFIMKPS